MFLWMNRKINIKRKLICSWWLWYQPFQNVEILLLFDIDLSTPFKIKLINVIMVIRYYSKYVNTGLPRKPLFTNLSIHIPHVFVYWATYYYKNVWQQQKQQNNLYFEKETPPSFKTSNFDKTLNKVWSKITFSFWMMLTFKLLILKIILGGDWQ